MILLYLSLLLLLGLLRLLVAVRVRLLEKKYARAARDAQVLAQQSAYKPGNGSRVDPYASAKQQYQLGSLVHKRDRAEARYAAWQASSEKLGRLLLRIRSFKGRFVPYVFGAVDVVLVLALLSLLGHGDLNPVARLVERITAWQGRG
jgi:hypothetical protein